MFSLRGNIIPGQIEGKELILTIFMQKYKFKKHHKLLKKYHSLMYLTSK